MQKSAQCGAPLLPGLIQPGIGNVLMLQDSS